MMLITIEQAKAQVRVVHDAEDGEITELIEDASEAIVGYMKDAADVFLTTGGDVIDEAVPADVRSACKLEVAHLFKNREGQSDSKIPDQYGYGYPLCAAAIAKLYRYRTPTFA